MNQEYNEELLERLNQFMATHDLSQAKMAKKLGMSDGTLSTYRNQKYKGNVEETEKKIEEFLSVEVERAKKSESVQGFQPVSHYVDTSVSHDVCSLIRNCQLDKGMVVLHGDAGIGKTIAAKQYVSENESTTIYMQISPSSSTLRNFMRLLARNLRISTSLSTFELMLEIREKLIGTNKIVIVDEAQHLKLTTLEEIRMLAEPDSMSGKSGIGIVLIGNSEIYNKMLGKGEAHFAQLFSRIRMNRKYTTGHVKESDMPLLFPALKSEKKELSFLLSVARSRWGVRGAVNVFNNAVGNRKIDVDGLRQVSLNMGMNIR